MTVNPYCHQAVASNDSKQQDRLEKAFLVRQSNFRNQKMLLKNVVLEIIQKVTTVSVDIKT